MKNTFESPRKQSTISQVFGISMYKDFQVFILLPSLVMGHLVLDMKKSLGHPAFHDVWQTSKIFQLLYNKK